MNSRLLESVLKTIPKIPGHLLDIPCGNGWLAKAAARSGHQVIAGDLHAHDLERIPFFLCDLNVAIPIRPGVFDLIYCSEGIEHVQNTHLLLSEFSRLLKGDGILILTFPNVLNIGSRFKFLFSGRFLSFPHLYEVRTCKAEEYVHEHINPVSLSQLLYIAAKYNLIWDGFMPQPYEPKKVVRRMWFLAFFQVVGMVKQALAANRSKRLLWSILSSRESLLHDHIIVSLRKREIMMDSP